jgi:hypothetical protein
MGWMDILTGGAAAVMKAMKKKPEAAEYEDPYQEYDRKRLWASRDQLNAAAQGQVPSAAAAQSRQELSDQAAAAQSLAASARGSQLGLAQKAGAQAAAMNMGNVAKQSAFARGTELTGAREEAARAAENVRRMDTTNAVNRAAVTEADANALNQFKEDQRTGNRDTALGAAQALMGAQMDADAAKADEEEDD